MKEYREKCCISCQPGEYLNKGINSCVNCEPGFACESSLRKNFQKLNIVNLIRFDIGPLRNNFSNLDIFAVDDI